MLSGLEAYPARSKIIRRTLRDLSVVWKYRKALNFNFSHNDSSAVIMKPWGFEYVWLKNKHLEIWHLFVNENCSTSFHCHPNKDTLLLVLKGSIELGTIQGSVNLNVGDFRLIKKGVLHRTKSISISGTHILEIESPPNKNDLLRVDDAYGRKDSKYEWNQSTNSLDVEKFSLKNARKINFNNADVFLEKTFCKFPFKVSLLKIELKTASTTLNIREVLNSIGASVFMIYDNQAKYRMRVFKPGFISFVTEVKNFDLLEKAIELIVW